MGELPPLGYRDRLWDTRVGAIELRIPKLRQGSCFPSLLEPCRRAEKALVAVGVMKIGEREVLGFDVRHAGTQITPLDGT